MSWTPSLSAGQGLRFGAVGVRMSHVLVLVDHLELFLCWAVGGNIPTWSFSPRPAIKATHAPDFLRGRIVSAGESAAAVDDQQHLQRHLDLYARVLCSGSFTM